MDVNTLVNNIANHTKSLVKRSVQKPFDFSISKLENKREIDKVGDAITILRCSVTFVMVIVIILNINSKNFENEYIRNVIRIFEITNNIYLAVFGVVLTAFSITTALWSNMAVKAIAGEKGQGDFSIFEELLLSYVSILFWSIIIIALNFVLLSCLAPLPDRWMLSFLGKFGADIISSILIGVYIFIISDVLLFNIDLLYNMYAAVVLAAYFRIKDSEKEGEIDNEKK